MILIAIIIIVIIIKPKIINEIFMEFGKQIFIAKFVVQDSNFAFSFWQPSETENFVATIIISWEFNFKKELAGKNKNFKVFDIGWNIDVLLSIDLFNRYFLGIGCSLNFSDINFATIIIFIEHFNSFIFDKEVLKDLKRKLHLILPIIQLVFSFLVPAKL